MALGPDFPLNAVLRRLRGAEASLQVLRTRTGTMGRRLFAAAVLALLLTAATFAAADASALPPTIHYTSADISVSDGGSYAPPPTTLSQISIPTFWTHAPLPHVVLRSGGRDPTTISTWYRLRYDAPASGDAVYLYVPRWQVTGTLAIYANRHLIYAPRSGPQWMSFNLPIWVRLANAGEKPPTDILIKISSHKASGGGISSLWIGGERSIALRHALRYWLQINLTVIISFLDFVLAMSALSFWCFVRREPAFVFLASACLFNIVWEIQFRTGEAPLYVSEPWFGWITICALEWWILSAYIFALRMIGSRSGALQVGLFIFTVAFTLLTLPVSETGVHLVSANLSPLLDAITLAGVLVMTVSLWVFYARRPTHEGLVVCIYNTIWPLAGVHDVMLQNYAISIETVCIAPLAFGLIPVSMLYLMGRQYVLNIKAADSYATRLEVRVGEREAELEKSYELLREVERRETVAVERQRLMRDMHDGMGSSLMGALVAVERGHLYQVEIAQMLRECIDDLKLTIDSLEAVESDLPLVLATLRYRLGPRFERAGIELVWNVGEVTAAGALDSERALHVLRMVQEMFSNIVKHASATRVTVTTIVEGQDVLLVVEDNGIGFSSVEAQGSQGRGMKNLVHRAAALGARFTWCSRPGETRFELRLPLNQDVRS